MLHCPFERERNAEMKCKLQRQFSTVVSEIFHFKFIFGSTKFRFDVLHGCLNTIPQEYNDNMIW